MADLTRLHWVIGNWKLNPFFQDAQTLYHTVNEQYAAQDELHICRVAIAPPDIYLSYFASQSGKIPCVAQDVSTVSGTGAYTGEVSAELLKQSQIDYVLIGHSERRALFGDDVASLQQKIRNAIQAGLTVVYCVGESLAEREAGHANKVVLQQLDDLHGALSSVQSGTAAGDWSKVIIAYEPIWAIGTGKTASPQDAQDMHAEIRAYLKNHTSYAEVISILYGGSVKPENAVQLAACEDIDGALVGGASLDASSFISIVHAFAQK